MIPLPGDKGVQFVAPPADLIPEITGKISRAIDAIGDADAAFVGVADRQGGWNAAFVTKGMHGWQVSTWIGKSWATDADLDYGVQVLKVWKF